MSTSLSPEEFSRWIRSADRIVALTGAGISTSAGIPDFRGPKGLYVTRQYDPERTFDIDFFREDPAPFYQFTRDFLGMIDRVEPTVAHRYLADLEEDGRLVLVVTQNIDMLHRRAGSKKVLPIHGDYSTAVCLECGEVLDFPVFRRKLSDEEIPLCDHCGGLIKPDVVFFGEGVKGFERALDQFRRADLVLVMGSSLAVQPAGALPALSGAPIIVINRGRVGLSPAPDRFFIDADLNRFLTEVQECS